MTELIVLIFCISLDVFVFMMDKGATVRINFKQSLIHGLIYGVIDASMLVIGDFIGNQIFHQAILPLNRLVASVIFIVIGIRIMVKALNRKPFEERLDLSFNYKESARYALLLGIDCILVGLGTSFATVPMFQEWLLAFIVTILVVFVALLVGYYRGSAHQARLCYLCSVIYIGMAVVEMAIIV